MHSGGICSASCLTAMVKWWKKAAEAVCASTSSDLEIVVAIVSLVCCNYSFVSVF